MHGNLNRTVQSSVHFYIPGHFIKVKKKGDPGFHYDKSTVKEEKQIEQPNERAA